MYFLSYIALLAIVVFGLAVAAAMLFVDVGREQWRERQARTRSPLERRTGERRRTDRGGRRREDRRSEDRTSVPPLHSPSRP